LGPPSRWEKSLVKRDGPVFFSSDLVKVAGDAKIFIVIFGGGSEPIPGAFFGVSPKPIPSFILHPSSFNIAPTGSSVMLVTLVQDLRWIYRDLKGFKVI
jgi:hypothetical protein